MSVDLTLVLTDDQLFDDAIAAEQEASPARWRAADRYAELHERGYSTRQIGERVGKSHVHIVYCLKAVTQVTGERGDFQNAYEQAKGVHVASSGENEWYTPVEYIEAARAVMGGIDLDPASSVEANEVVQAGTFYTLEQDGLAQEWRGRVWMNPPYNRPLIDNFCGKLGEDFAAGHVTAACVMCNNATETGWFHALAEVASAFCFPRQRVRFWQPEKETATGLQGQAVVYLGENVDGFRAEFLQFGFTVIP